MAKVRPQLPFAAPLLPWWLLQSPNVPGFKARHHDRYPLTDVCGNSVCVLVGNEALPETHLPWFPPMI